MILCTKKIGCLHATSLWNRFIADMSLYGENSQSIGKGFTLKLNKPQKNYCDRLILWFLFVITWSHTVLRNDRYKVLKSDMS